MRKSILVLMMLLFSVPVFASVVPNEAYVKGSGRTPADVLSDKDDMEIRIGASKLNIYNVYVLCEREDYLFSNPGEWYMGYGGIVDLLKKRVVKLQFETFDRHRYDSNFQSFRAFFENKPLGVHVKYGASLLGRHYQDYQPAGFLGLSYKGFSGVVEMDINKRIVSCEQFKSSIPFSKTTGLGLDLQHRKADRNFYKVQIVVYYKEAL